MQLLEPENLCKPSRDIIHVEYLDRTRVEKFVSDIDKQTRRVGDYAGWAKVESVAATWAACKRRSCDRCECPV